MNKTRVKVPRIAFADIKEDILGKKYELSVAFVTPRESAKLAKTYKHKKYEANVLSFPLSKSSGEVIICPQVAKRQAKEYGTDFRGMVGLLFIHGLLHLVGERHGSKMESQECRSMKKYGL